MATKSTVAGQHEDFDNSKAGIRALLQGLRRALGQRECSRKPWWKSSR
jgi:hypothetical protein